MTLGSFATDTYVEITASGDVSAVPNGTGITRSWGASGLFWSDAWGTMCAMRVGIAFTELGGYTPTSCGNNGNTTGFVTRQWVRGTGTATRGGPLPGAPDVTYSGAHEVNLSVLTLPKPVLQPSAQHVDAGDVVSWTAPLSGSWDEQWQVLSWNYVSADPRWAWAGNTGTGSTAISGTAGNNFLMWMSYKMAGRTFQSDTVLLTVKEPPNWTLKSDQTSYAPGATITLTRGYSDQNGKWDARSRSDGFFLYTTVPGNRYWKFVQGSYANAKQYTYTATYAVSGAHTAETSGKTQDRQRRAWTRVRVIVCPVQDTILDEKSVRDSLKKVWTQSNGTDPNFANRREVPFGFYHDSVTGADVLRWFPDPNATPCRTYLNNLQFNSTLFADGHSHPFKHGDSVPTSFTNCLDQGVYPATYDAYAYGGPSDDDWNQTTYQDRFYNPNSTNGMPFVKGKSIVIDEENIYVADPSTLPAQRATQTKRFKRVTGPTCQQGEIKL